MRTALTDKIFRVAGKDMFKETALEIFRFQATGCPLYSEYLRLLGTDIHGIDDICSIPFMPISFFRDHTVITGGGVPERIFLSSGTQGVRQSRHAVTDTGIYDESIERAFRIYYGDPGRYAVMGLLPSYLEREGSSLIYMVRRLMSLSGHEYGGFFPDNHDALIVAIRKAREQGLRVMIIGVTFALLDLAGRHPTDMRDVIIMETGGMKGRRREMIREEVHDIIRSAFGVSSVHSEYSMTELLSQAYSKGEGLFTTPPWMKVLIRDNHDPLSHTCEAGAAGGISIIDLANIWSCSFIATADLGRMHNDSVFEVLGRYDNSDIRGCSLLTENGLL